MCVIGFWFNTIVTERQTLSDSYSFTHVVSFIAQKMVYLGECSLKTWEEHMFCCCWLECSIHGNWVRFSSLFTLIFCPLVHLLPREKWSAHYVVDLSISPSSLSLLHALWSSVVRCTHFRTTGSPRSVRDVFLWRHSMIFAVRRNPST